MTHLLREIAYVRSGDKGDICSFGVIAKAPEYYNMLLRAVTPERIKQLYGDFVKGAVHVYRLDNIHAVNVVMEQALGGGAPSTLRLDQTAKSLGHAILRLSIDGMSGP
jgi:hypothetical protein